MRGSLLRMRREDRELRQRLFRVLWRLSWLQPIVIYYVVLIKLPHRQRCQVIYAASSRLLPPIAPWSTTTDKKDHTPSTVPVPPLPLLVLSRSKLHNLPADVISMFFSSRWSVCPAPHPPQYANTAKNYTKTITFARMPKSGFFYM